MRNIKLSICWLLVLCTSAPILCTSTGDFVPVLIWGGDSPSTNSNRVNPLHKTSGLEFEKIVSKLIGTSQPPILIFTRDHLCIEDLSQHKKDLGVLQKTKLFRYVPAVESPMSAFAKLTTYNQSIEEEVETISDGQLIMTKVTDLDAIVDIYNLIKRSSPNLLAVLTGRSCNHNKSDRIKRQAEPAKTEKKAEPVGKEPFVIFVNTTKDQFLLTSDDPPKYKDKTFTVESVTVEGNSTGPGKFKVNVNFKPNDTVQLPPITFVLDSKSPGYWSMNKIEMKNETEPIILTSNVNLVFPMKFGYHCSQGVKFTNRAENQTLTFTNFQVQVGVTNFTDAYDCVGFTSIPIWSGLFVTAIIALIIFWGITMIMDIRTMDRFDDPKGKTITISAQE